MSKLHDLYTTYGQSAWIDNIRRDWLNDGTLAQLVSDGVRGVTSNPSIFAKAFATSNAYDTLIDGVGSVDPEVIFETLAAADVRDACDILAPVYESSLRDMANGSRRFLDGYVSLEVSPRLARDTDGTIEAAQRLFAEVQRPNVMIKIPATPEGIAAIPVVLAQGINVNVTLIFSVERYRAVLRSWTDGLMKARERGVALGPIGSVASFFVSRVDAAVDPLLPSESALRGSIANAQVAAAYEAYLEHVASDSVVDLLASGAQVQRPLWASTSTKDPSYHDLLYVDEIVANETVNTMPDATMSATIDHGSFENSLLRDPAARHAAISLLASLPPSVSLDAITTTLERDGVESFMRSYDELLATVTSKVQRSSK